MARDTGPAKLPALPPVALQDPQMAAWVSAVTERLQVREGTRGNENERAVTLRELKELKAGLDDARDATDKIAKGLGLPGMSQGTTVSDVVDAFQNSIRELKLYKDLMKSLDDPSRFDDLRKEVRDVLLNSIADEAAKRGAEIRRTEKIISDANLSIAMRVDEVTAAASNAATGVRETVAATAEVNRAQAVKVTQLEAKVDGQKAAIEEQMTVTADKVQGLSAQYTVKLQAGKAVAGFGLAATETAAGKTTSAFLVSADKFAIINPSTYNGSLVNPSEASIPFGVDTNGIYMRSTVYLDGNMRIKGSGVPQLSLGLRGSVNINGPAGAWNDSRARVAVHAAIGGPGSSARNDYLVIGDTVTMVNGESATTKMWSGSSWIVPAVAIDGNLLVNGSVSAGKIDTRGLVVRDNYGQPILTSGSSTTAAIRNALGLGGVATKDSIQILSNGSDILVNNIPLKTTDFVNKLSKINSSTIGSFMESAAIGNAFIGNAAVDTLKIENNAVTFTVGVYATSTIHLGDNNTPADGIIISAATNCSGAPINIHVAFHCRPFGDVDGYKDRYHSWESQLIRVVNGVETVIFTGWLGYARVRYTNTYGWGLGSVAFNRRDNPGEGVVSYILRVYNAQGENGITVYHRSMLLSELKK